MKYLTTVSVIIEADNEIQAQLKVMEALAKVLPDVLVVGYSAFHDPIYDEAEAYDDGA